VSQLLSLRQESSRRVATFLAGSCLGVDSTAPVVGFPPSKKGARKHDDSDISLQSPSPPNLLGGDLGETRLDVWVPLGRTETRRCQSGTPMAGITGEASVARLCIARHAAGKPDAGTNVPPRPSWRVFYVSPADRKRLRAQSVGTARVAGHDDDCDRRSFAALQVCGGI